MKPRFTTDVKRGTYNIIRKAIERDLVRDLGNSELPIGLGAVGSCTLPLQDDLTVINRDQPASNTSQLHYQCSWALTEVKNASLRLDRIVRLTHDSAERESEEELPRRLAHTLTFSARVRRHRRLK
jgi:hypothetical protein